MLRREDFSRERIDWYRAEAERAGLEPEFLSHEARDASLAAELANIAPGEDVWVFAYGSLMWNPAIEIAETRRARVTGYHRAFCLDLRLGRGSPDRPGLMLGLDRGGGCVGLGLRIAAGNVRGELEILWLREMLTGAYVPRWLSARDEQDRMIRMLTFVINRAHKRYVGRQTPEETARRIAHAEGLLGSNRVYLYRTVEHMDALGVPDRAIRDLARRVRALAPG